MAAGAAGGGGVRQTLTPTTTAAVTSAVATIGGRDAKRNFEARSSNFEGHRRRDRRRRAGREPFFQLQHAFANVAQPALGIFLEAAPEQAADGSGQIRGQRGPVGLRLEHRREHFRHVVALERSPARQHFRNTRRRTPTRPRADRRRAPCSLLRRHARPCPESCRAAWTARSTSASWIRPIARSRRRRQMPSPSRSPAL
jgi:hypothetical protein